MSQVIEKLILWMIKTKLNLRIIYSIRFQPSALCLSLPSSALTRILLTEFWGSHILKNLINPGLPPWLSVDLSTNSLYMDDVFIQWLWSYSWPLTFLVLDLFGKKPDSTFAFSPDCNGFWIKIARNFTAHLALEYCQDLNLKCPPWRLSCHIIHSKGEWILRTLRGRAWTEEWATQASLWRVPAVPNLAAVLELSCSPTRFYLHPRMEPKTLKSK